MTALTDPHTIDASIAPEVGTIDEADTLIVEFTVSGGRIAQDCDFEIVFPASIGFDEGNFSSVRGKGCFSRTTSSTSSYREILTTYDFADRPSDGTYGGTFKGKGLCPKEITPLSCGIEISGVKMPAFVAATETFKIYVTDSSGGLVAQQETGLTITAA